MPFLVHTPALGKRVTADWQEYFPGFGLYRRRWLGRRVGPLFQGLLLEVKSDRTQYEPLLHVHNFGLAHDSVSLSLSQPLLSERTRAPMGIRFQFHADHVAASAQRLRAESRLPLEGPVALSQVLAAHAAHWKTPAGAFPVVGFEDTLLLLTWAGRVEHADRTLAAYLREMRRWPPNVMARVGGPAAWEARMRAELAAPERVRERAEANALALQASELPAVELIIDV